MLEEHPAAWALLGLGPDQITIDPEFLPKMLEAGGGAIVNIASIGGKLAVPHLPDDCLVYLTRSPYCHTARVSQIASDLFGMIRPA